MEFYYGEESLINATLYQMLASYYSLVSKEKEDLKAIENNVVTLYAHATSIIIKYYGDQSEQIAELYLSRAVAFLNLKSYELFERDI